MQTIRTHNSWNLKSGLAKSLVCIAFLNLNGLAYMLWGVTQLFSLLLLCFSLLLAGLHRRLEVDAVVALYLIWMFGYIFFGMLFIPFFNDASAGLSDLPGLIGTVLLTLAITMHLQHAVKNGQLEPFMRFSRSVALVSALANIFSQLLYTIYRHPPPSAGYRNAGVFANPNNAGLMAAVALALLLMYPFRNKVVQYGCIGLILVALIMPFSRAAILAAILIIIFPVLKSSRVKLLFVIPTLGAVLFVLFANITVLIDWLNTQSLIDLSPQQEQRLVGVLLVLDGQIDQETSGARSTLWAFAVEKAGSVFPLGTGLGSLHAMQGGVTDEKGNWLGAHNSFLMVWGEAGFAPLLAMVLLLVTAAYRAVRSPLGVQGLFFPFLFLSYAMVSHNLLPLRFMNIVTAFMLVQGMVHLMPRYRHSLEPGQNLIEQGT